MGIRWCGFRCRRWIGSGAGGRRRKGRSGLHMKGWITFCTRPASAGIADEYAEGDAAE